MNAGSLRNNNTLLLEEVLKSKEDHDISCSDGSDDSCQDPALIRLLLDHNADVNAVETDISMSESREGIFSGLTGPQTALMIAVHAGLTSVVETITTFAIQHDVLLSLSSSPSPADHVLTHSVAHGDVKMTHLLVDYLRHTCQHRCVDEYDDAFTVGLMAACMVSDATMVRLMLDNGADPNIITDTGRSLLSQVFCYNNDDESNHHNRAHGFYANGVDDNEDEFEDEDVDYDEDDESDVLTRIVTMLLNSNANITAITGVDRQSALHTAVSCDNTRVVCVLCEHKADVNVVDAHGSTALHYAAKQGNADVIAILTRFGAK